MTTTETGSIEHQVDEFCHDLRRLRDEIATLIVGQDNIVEGVIMKVSRKPGPIFFISVNIGFI